MALDISFRPGSKFNNTTIENAPDDMPLFVIKPSDPGAKAAVDTWVNQHEYELGASHPKIVSARKFSAFCEAYIDKKLPD